MYRFITLPLLLLQFVVPAQQNDNQVPVLRRQGNATQLIADRQPFLVLGGELGNSTASDPDYLQPAWEKMKHMNCNTALVPVYWELIEPEKGKFDFALVDGIIDSSRKHNMKIILLWFGSWKNSMSCYVPRWIKKDFRTYPRAYDQEGTPQEILTPFSENNFQADLAAFLALIKHVKEKDNRDHTVLMIQVENEIGMLPSARDHHPDANKAFNAEVPDRLMQYIRKNKKTLSPHLLKLWESAGTKNNGTWEQVFGKSPATDEIFIAWYFADFTNKLAREGKRIYPLPMFVNAALNRPNVKPGDYPSGGPLPHLIDIWKAAAPAVDFLSPDFYNPDFKHWNDQYAREDNPLFIPEIRFDSSVAAKVFYAIGHYHAIGFSPFSIESTNSPEDEPLGKSYAVLSQLAPIISLHQGQSTMNGSLLEKTFPVDTIRMGDYQFIVKHDYTLGWSPKSKEELWPHAGGLIIQSAPDEFIVAGTGIVVTFSLAKPGKTRVGILNIQEGVYQDGKWKPVRTLNGDQSHQGRHLRIEMGDYGIQNLRLYKYE